MTEKTQIRLMGAICVILGVSVALIPLGVIPYDESKLHAPTWILLLCGSLFIFGGMAMLLKSRPLAVNLLGNLMVLIFATVAAWIALFGEAGQFSGGIPMLSDESNVHLARVVFGLGALLCALMLIPGIRHLVKLLRERAAPRDRNAANH